MSNIEHLIENALTAMSNRGDKYQAFVGEMGAKHNRKMLQEVSVTKEELWEIAQYIFYTWIPTIDPVHAAGACYCRECKYADDSDDELRLVWCKANLTYMRFDGFCSVGERRVE